MKSKILFLFLMAVMSAYPQVDKSILKKSDDAFFPEIAKLTVVMKLYDHNKYNRYYELTCYVKGNRKYLAIFKNPPIVRRRAQLRVGEKIWYYMGKINRTWEMSAKASFGESVFTEEDVLSTSLGYYYNLEKVEDVELNGKKVLKLSLKSHIKKTAYYRIESFIDKKTLLPIKRNYYSFSNQKIKELDVIEIRKKNNKLQYAHLIMHDSLRKGRYTEVEFKNFEYPEKLSDRMFTKRYMEIACE